MTCFLKAWIPPERSESPEAQGIGSVNNNLGDTTWGITLLLHVMNSCEQIEIIHFHKSSTIMSKDIGIF